MNCKDYAQLDVPNQIKDLGTPHTKLKENRLECSFYLCIVNFLFRNMDTARLGATSFA